VGDGRLSACESESHSIVATTKRCMELVSLLTPKRPSSKNVLDLAALIAKLT